MIFNSLAFAIFLPVVLALYYVLPFKGQNRMLLVASLFFYAWWDWRFLGLLALTILIDFYASHAVYRAKTHKEKKRWMLISIISNITVLVIFKYSNFFVQSFASMLTKMGFAVHAPILQLVLPIGISFYTFMSMAYVIDVYRGELTPTRHLFDFALFVCYFPHLVAGPILRAPQLLPQLTHERRVKLEQIRDGVALIVIGYVRKVLIADIIAPMVGEAFTQMDSLGSGDLILRMYLFAIQLYGDFAGYSDIARGVSKLFGIELNLNFATPYLSQNITEFWRRWHISLSSWLRDYVYIPLGGNRKGKFRTYVNNFLTMLIGGLWHGANWTYVVWGGLNGLYLAVHKAYLDITGKPQKQSLEPARWTFATPFKVFFIFTLAAFAFIIFRSPNFSSAAAYIAKMFSFHGGITRIGSSIFILPFVLLSFLIDVAQYTRWGERFVARIPMWQRAIVFGILFAFVLAAGADNSQPFIYFQF
ncbi:MAG: MBOAT family O-acyltransferase [Bacteroidota bacterium]|nr:MBOAT family O-acyltransferase [Bacteroidota bacterium]MDP4235901.1 MBOAT family O-acyltransferase [Bacteroidota bacterium]